MAGPPGTPRAAGGLRPLSPLLRHRLGAARTRYKRKSSLVNNHRFLVKKKTNKQLFRAGWKASEYFQ